MRHALRVLMPAFILLGLAAGSVAAQEILLDKTVRAGELQLFQDFSDPTAYYYVPDKVRLAQGDDGRPQFSFLKFVSNVESAPGEADQDEGEGGGIVHCLVQLGASEEQIQEAQGELRRTVPGARIVGPLIFRGGKFGLISNFKQENGDWTTQVVGIGNAPILEGEKAAVSIRLTKMGAKILWESFKTAAPDISFSFEMEMAGYRSPYDATLIANFDQIYKHRDFAAAGASTHLGFQIRNTLDELRDSGAIKMEVKGEDDKLDALMATAYGKICDLMFDKMETGHFAPEQGGPFDLINAASTYLRNQREQVRAENAAVAAAERVARSDGPPAVTAANYQPVRSSQAGGGPPATDLNSRRPPAASSSSSTPGGTSGGSGSTPSGQPGSGSTGGGTAASSQGGSSGAGSQPGTTTGSRGTGTSARSGSSRRSEPSFSLLAGYRMKQVRRTGEFRLSFKKYTSDTMQLRFDENIGNLSRLMSDRRHFYEVNLDDPVFKQREIAVYLDGQNAADFDKYVNYVTVRLRKQHEGGKLTSDEIRIDRTNFSQNGNYFKLLYGWKDDKNRDKWMDYEYNTVWSFHGGSEIDLGWDKSRVSAITAMPPLRKRSLHFEADPIAIQDAGVRLITVKVYYDVAGQEKMEQLTLNPASGQLSQVMQYICPSDELEYDYEITWRIRGGDTISSGRRSSTDDFVFCDEIPAS